MLPPVEKISPSLAQKRNNSSRFKAILNPKNSLEGNNSKLSERELFLQLCQVRQLRFWRVPSIINAKTVLIDGGMTIH